MISASKHATYDVCLGSMGCSNNDILLPAAIALTYGSVTECLITISII